MTLGLLLGFAASTLHGLSGGGQGVVDRTLSPDGRHELVVEHWQAMIDDPYDGKLRSSAGAPVVPTPSWRRASGSCTAPRATRAPSGSLRSTA